MAYPLRRPVHLRRPGQRQCRPRCRWPSADRSDLGSPNAGTAVPLWTTVKLDDISADYIATFRRSSPGRVEHVGAHSIRTPIWPASLPPNRPGAACAGHRAGRRCEPRAGPAQVGRLRSVYATLPRKIFDPVPTRGRPVLQPLTCTRTLCARWPGPRRGLTPPGPPKPHWSTRAASWLPTSCRAQPKSTIRPFRPTGSTGGLLSSIRILLTLTRRSPDRAPRWPARIVTEEARRVRAPCSLNLNPSGPGHPGFPARRGKG